VHKRANKIWKKHYRDLCYKISRYQPMSKPYARYRVAMYAIKGLLDA